MREELYNAPPSLASLFPDLRTLDEKAFRFLEIKYEKKTYRRTAAVLGIHHNTVASIYEFLQDTDVYHRFQAIVADQIKDFYSAQNLTDLFETYRTETKRLETLISKALKDGKENEALKFIKEKRMFLKDQLATSLACRGHVTDEKARKAIDTDTSIDTRYWDDHRDVLEQAKNFEESESEESH